MEERTDLAYPPGTGALLANRGEPRPFPGNGVHAPRQVLLAALWSQVREGRLALSEHFVSERASFAVLHERSEADAAEHRFTPAQVEIFQRLVAGERQNALAIDLALSPAAVTFRAQRCVQLLGLDCRLSGLPLFLVIAALSAAPPDDGPSPMATVEAIPGGDANAALYRVARVDLVLPATLTGAEQEVARMVVEGQSPTAIANARQTTERTAANQLRAAFGKLGVTGRLELIARLAGARPLAPRNAP